MIAAMPRAAKFAASQAVRDEWLRRVEQEYRSAATTHHLTLWLILALVAIINITSFLLFIFFRLIYRWIKQDLNPTDED